MEGILHSSIHVKFIKPRWIKRCNFYIGDHRCYYGLAHNHKQITEKYPKFFMPIDVGTTLESLAYIVHPFIAMY